MVQAWSRKHALNYGGGNINQIWLIRLPQNVKRYFCTKNESDVWNRERASQRSLVCLLCPQRNDIIVVASVTRFGEISPLWQTLKCLWQFYEGSFSTWQKLLPTSTNFVYNWAMFHGCKWTNNEDHKSHLVTLIIVLVFVLAFSVRLASASLHIKRNFNRLLRRKLSASFSVTFWGSKFWPKRGMFQYLAILFLPTYLM